MQLIPVDTRPSHFTSRIPGPTHSNIPMPSSKRERPSSAGKKNSPQSPPKQVKNASGSKLQHPMASPQLAKKLLVAEKVPPSFEPEPPLVCLCFMCSCSGKCLVIAGTLISCRIMCRCDCRCDSPVCINSRYKLKCGLIFGSVCHGGS